MKRLLLTLTLLWTAPAAAHDFWIQPAQFHLGGPGTTTLTLQVGHGAERQRSQIRAGRITRFATIDPDGTARDLRPGLHIGDDSDADLALQAEGAHMLVLETDDHAQSHLPAARYNAYLVDEGLTPVAVARAASHRIDVEGSESYRRIAKAIVQIGSAGDQGQATRSFGLPLEIVPERSPHALPRAASLPLRVLLHGQPLGGALIKLTALDHDEVPVEVHRTDPQGRAVFVLPVHGSWQFNVVWSEPQAADAPTEYETSFSSLSFGFQ